MILLRGGGHHASRGLEVALLRRHPEARFMPGVWVFPGGAVREDDHRTLDGRDEAFRRCAVRELAEEAGLVLADRRALVAYSRWVTPAPLPLRFDTRFYLARGPAHAPLTPDGKETVDGRWMAPAEALEAARAGSMSLSFPTQRDLEGLVQFATAEAALRARRAPEPVAVQPRLRREGDEILALLPTDPRYAESAPAS